MNLEHLSQTDKGLAIKIATLRVIQKQRKISDKAIDRLLGLRNGATSRFFQGDEAYLYLADRIEQAIEKMSKGKGRRMEDKRARRELTSLRGEWVDADRWIKLVERARGGDPSIYYQTMMEQEPFYGDGEE